MALKFVPQGGGNPSSNETALHESEDDDIEPDGDTSQQSTSSPLTCVPSSLTSTAAAAASASLSAPSQISTSSSQLVTSQDSDNEMKDMTSSEEDSLCEENISLEESLVASSSTDCISSPKLVPSTVECSNVSSTSHPPIADTTVNAVADNHTTDTVEEIAVTNAPLSSSIALPDVTTPLDDDMEAPTSSSTSDGMVTIEDDGNSRRRTPARHAKLNRVLCTDKDENDKDENDKDENDKDENKVTDNIY